MIDIIFQNTLLIGRSEQLFHLISDGFGGYFVTPESNLGGGIVIYLIMIGIPVSFFMALSAGAGFFCKKNNKRRVVK